MSAPMAIPRAHGSGRNGDFNGSKVNLVGYVWRQRPAASTRFAFTCSIFICIIESIKNQQMLSLIEIIGFIFGLYGSIILSYPELIEKYCFCLCLK